MEMNEIHLSVNLMRFHVHLYVLYNAASGPKFKPSPPSPPSHLEAGGLNSSSEPSPRLHFRSEVDFTAEIDTGSENDSTQCFVQQLDGFISWLQGALDSTENWTQPRQELDSLGVYLDTHLSFKMDVESHSVLKESVVEEGRALLAVITSHQSGLKDILLMVSSQWDQLQRQIRRQHGWMLRALRCIQARLLHSCQSHELLTAATEPADGLKVRLESVLEL
ncbi:unnamed protein product [Pleuronectes platessa]|uniref:Uncharacterized protein n=1 Tax=Pleuronectes platessa TaxID=8262 RepID=A0A9N7YPV3_PLEPL|nr:unnamed protein product [Pleuronectes platessa]